MNTNLCFMVPPVSAYSQDGLATIAERTIDCGTSKAINLTGSLHELFDRKRWEASDEEYNLLLPSMRLASNLIYIGMPWLANTLPTAELFRENSEELAERSFQRLPTNVEQREIVIPSDTVDDTIDIASAKEALVEIAEHVRWQVNYEMYRGHHYDGRGQPLEWQGITRLVDTGRPWEPISPEDIEAADEKSRNEGRLKRPLIVGIMGEYVTALKYGKAGSEPHLRATFMAGITMAHEVGHVVFHQDFRSPNPPFLQEPWYGDECSAELGFSFISSIFGGWHPQARFEGAADFSLSLYWEPRYTLAQKKRPLYKTLYAMTIEYAEKLLSQEFWDAFDDPRDLDNPTDLIDLQMELSPARDIREASVARVPNWSYSYSLRQPEWNDPTFRLEGYTQVDRVLGVTPEELEYGKERAKHLGKGLDNDEEELPRTSKPLKAGISEPVSLGICLLSLDDGVLAADVKPALELPNTPLTRIEVKFLTGNSRKRRATLDLTTPNAKRAKHGEEYSASRAASYKDVTDFLLRVNPLAISRWTRITAHDFCVDHDLQSYRRLADNDFWQSSQLDLTISEDLAIAHRICEYKLTEALQLPLFASDPDAQVQMKEASLPYFQEWDYHDLVASGPQQSLDPNTYLTSTHAELVTKKVKWRKEDKDTTRKHGKIQALHPARRAGLPRPRPELLSYTSLIEFCRARSLPEWGTPKALAVRAQRSLIQPQYNRPTQPFRTDAHGFETYVFRAILGQSTVTALKSALFVEGGFPPDAELTLYFEPEAEPLVEGAPLLVYAHKDWTSLRLEVETKGWSAPGGKGALGDITGRNQVGDRRDAQKKALRERGRMTVLEKFERVRKRIGALDRLVRVPVVGKARDSTIDILEEVEDLEEIEEGRGRSEKRKKRNPLSHMASIYDRIDHPSRFQNGRPVF